MPESLPGKAQSHTAAVLQHLVREAATTLLARSLEMELAVFLCAHDHRKGRDGGRAVVRNGYLPSRTLRTSAGDVTVRVPRTRDRNNSGINFISRMIPPYYPRSRRDEPLSSAFLQSSLECDYRPFLQTLLGVHIHQLPPAVAAGIQQAWAAQYAAQVERSPMLCKHLCWYVDVLHTQLGETAAMERPNTHWFFIVGLRSDGRHELVDALGTDDVVLDPTPQWQALLARLRHRGLHKGPELVYTQHPAFLTALRQAFPQPFGIPNQKTAYP